MTATEKLREMLDERGIEHEDDEGIGLFGSGTYTNTSWNDGRCCYAEGFDDNGETLGLPELSALMTPEQAVAATVGTGTCRLKKGETTWFAGYNGHVTEWTCDECGGLTFYDAEMRPRFCADCGRRVEENI